jgi:AhpD family alkylhydroperoxidase
MSKKDELLRGVKEKFGFVPNIIEELSTSPEATELYLKGQEIIARGVLNDKERNAAMLAVSALNDCDYCTTAHAKSSKSAGISDESIQSISSRKSPNDDQLAPVYEAVSLLQDKKGWLDKDDVQNLEGKGISKQKLYEIIAIIAVKTITNYVNHISSIEIDKEFSS